MLDFHDCTGICHCSTCDVTHVISHPPLLVHVEGSLGMCIFCRLNAMS